MEEKNETIKFINYHALIITVIFSLFGGALVNFLEIPELKLRYISIASLLGLVLILLIQLLISVRSNKKVKQVFKIISVVLFICLVVALFRFDRAFEEGTFRYTDSDGVTERYINGTEEGLQPAARFSNERSIKQDGISMSNQQLVENFGGINIRLQINNIAKVWTTASIQANKRRLITDYIIMAMLFVANIYFLTEVFINFFKKKKQSNTRRVTKNGKVVPLIEEPG